MNVNTLDAARLTFLSLKSAVGRESQYSVRCQEEALSQGVCLFDKQTKQFRDLWKPTGLGCVLLNGCGVGVERCTFALLSADTD